MRKKKELKGKVEIKYGADNFCYVKAMNGRRVDLTEWMKKFDGKNVIIKVFPKSQLKEQEKKWKLLLTN